MENKARRRAGSAFIEVLLALVLLALSGTALITLLGQTAATMRSTLESEQLAHAAAAEMNHIVIVSRADLFAQLGRHTVRGWTVDIDAVSPTLFAVSVARSDTSAQLLHTTLYRPPSDTADGAR